MIKLERLIPILMSAIPDKVLGYESRTEEAKLVGKIFSMIIQNYNDIPLDHAVKFRKFTEYMIDNSPEEDRKKLREILIDIANEIIESLA